MWGLASRSPPPLVFIIYFKGLYQRYLSSCSVIVTFNWNKMHEIGCVSIWKHNFKLINIFIHDFWRLLNVAFKLLKLIRNCHFTSDYTFLVRLNRAIFTRCKIRKIISNLNSIDYSFQSMRLKELLKCMLTIFYIDFMTSFFIIRMNLKFGGSSAIHVYITTSPDSHVYNMTLVNCIIRKFWNRTLSGLNKVTRKLYVIYKN